VHLAAAVGRPDAHAGELPVAYVELKPGAVISEDELMDFLRGQISERAALPKQIRIVDSIPLTAVGKIFKPELKRRETADALRAALHEGGVRIKSLAVSDGKSSGTSIKLELDDPAQQAAAAAVLGRFPFAFAFGAAHAS
jgi:fatty-acyl-CoA synthase